MNNENRKILFVGAGAIGASIAAWVAPHHAELYSMGTGEVQQTLNAKGITIYKTDSPDKTRETVKAKTIDRIEDLPNVDVIVLGVKNYSFRKKGPLLIGTPDNTLTDELAMVQAILGRVGVKSRELGLSLQTSQRIKIEDISIGGGQYYSADP